VRGIWEGHKSKKGEHLPPRVVGERTKLIAPQWIGDAVMTEPLMLIGRSRRNGALPCGAGLVSHATGVCRDRVSVRHGDCSSALGVDWPGAVEGDIAYVCPVNPEKRVTVLLAKDRGWLR
jgi:hypothetical protein